jgi:SAM-dependent methyltransferase
VADAPSPTRHGASGAITDVTASPAPAGMEVDQRPLGTRPPADRRRLLLLSFLMLFVELALIRWTAANVLHLAYLTNFVLLASFLGIGVGFLRAKAARDLLPLAPVALAALVAFVLAFPVEAARLSGDRQLVGRLGLPALPQAVVLPVIFLLTVVIMAAVGQAVARTFARFEPLDGYRLDVLGSIVGIAAFSLLSFLQFPPVVWGLVAALGFALVLNGHMGRWQRASLAGIVVLLGAQSLVPVNHWSPYYKVTAKTPPDRQGTMAVKVNNIPHQTLHPVARLRELAPFYFYPYRHLGGTAPADVLVVGAGTGNDVAVALSQRAGHVDAVEIDPILYRLGRDHHPDRPYQDPRVRARIDDGRAFLQQTGRRYDLILFALPDSLTLVSGQSSLRLENYLFTVEAMRQAKAHLKPGGTFTMYNYYEPSLLDRYAGTLARVYGRPPCVETGEVLGARRQAVLTIGDDGTTRACAATWQARTVAPATDDHPFPYLEGRRIPSFYLVWLGLILVASLLLVRLATGPFRRMAPYLDLWFMGAAFLLLETKNVVQFALLFGTTWFVNATVFAGILLSVLAAVELARRVRLPGLLVLYAALLASLVVAWAVPQASLLALSPPVRFVAATAVAFTPIFLANLVFAQRFKNVGSSTVAFGANLLGAMVGGVLEYLALLNGYRFLLVLVAVLYGLAFAFGRAHLAAPRLGRA